MRRRLTGLCALLLLLGSAGGGAHAETAAAAAPPNPAAGQADDDRPLDLRTYAQGMDALRSGRRDEAARLLRRVFTDFPSSPQAAPALLEMARLLYPATKWSQVGSATPQTIEQAGDLLGRLAQKYRSAPEAARALVMLGYLGLEPANPQSNLDEACGRFATAVQIYPDSDAADDAFFASGMCDALRARPARAADDFGRLLEEHPDSPLAAEALFRQGVALSLLGDPAEAMLALQAVRTRYPDSPFAASALERQTLLHRLRLQPGLLAKSGNPSAAPLDWTLLYRTDLEYGAAPGVVIPAAIRGISDISIDAQGLAVVASPRTPGVFRLDARGRVQEQINHPGPDHIAAAEGLAVFISGRQQIAVNARNWSGTDLKGPGGRPPTDYGPIAVDSMGRVHLLDRRENAILIYDRTRRLTGAVRPPGGKDGRFVDLSAGNEGGIYALDGRARIVVALHQGRETRRTVLSASMVQDPIALAVDGIGDLYLLDAVTRAIVVCDPDGRPITVVRPTKEMLQQIGEPSSLAVDAFGRIYLAGRKSGRVVRFQ